MAHIRRVTTKTKIDFGDEEAVLDEMVDALDVEPDELTIEEDRGLTSFDTGTVYRVELGRQEYMVVEDEDQAHDLAIEIVTQDLEEEPEIFEKGFIESHIDEKKLRDELESDVLNDNIDTCTDIANDEPNRFWREYKLAGFDAPEEDEDGERPEPTSSEIEELAEAQTKDQLRDPMEYLDDIYGDEAAKKAIEIAGIDVEAAAKEAVSTDGEGHFLSGYDGETHETKGGLVYWRTN
jgi:hypothetical protein